MPAAFLSSNKQDYATPWGLVEALEKELGRRFTLDVCASEKSAKAPKYYNAEKNGLMQDWAQDAWEDFPHAAWCNPEYGDGKIPLWIMEAAKLADPCTVFGGLTTVFLLPANKTDQAWWHKLVIPFHAVWDVKGRVDFLDPETGEVPKVWKWKDGKEELGAEFIGDPSEGKWIKQSNPQASKIVIVGPGFPPCLPRSFIWK
jgi:phage N-6-adenine-methyltransferase